VSPFSGKKNFSGFPIYHINRVDKKQNIFAAELVLWREKIKAKEPFEAVLS
jgi:hypothetical protein